MKLSERCYPENDTSGHSTRSVNRHTLCTTKFLQTLTNMSTAHRTDKRKPPYEVRPRHWIKFIKTKVHLCTTLMHDLTWIIIQRQDAIFRASVQRITDTYIQMYAHTWMTYKKAMWHPHSISLYSIYPSQVLLVIHAYIHIFVKPLPLCDHLDNCENWKFKFSRKSPWTSKKFTEKKIKHWVVPICIDGCNNTIGIMIKAISGSNRFPVKFGNCINV